MLQLILSRTQSRFGQQNPKNLPDIGDKCPGGICGRLSGDVPKCLVALAPPCAAQDLADTFITESKTNPEITDKTTKKAMIKFAQALASAEKNTPPDYTTSPITLRNALYCTKPPKNTELIGYYVTQDPANEPAVFFDPSTKSTVHVGPPGTKPPGPRANLTSTTNSTFIENPNKSKATGRCPSRRIRRYKSRR
ncbi:expressed protein [Phakopsora pachyrhizi]|uniref:Expressed protein n=1 Tax=Phakopsora pachyrhizi TaxID=170000 RepID=A0AAV0BK32_PHAPC|nr:expressed protein [Phakopsora pachyrhizi]